MNAPCGHKEAACVIGNFWTCAVCDEPKPAEPAMTFAGNTFSSVRQHAKSISFTFKGGNIGVGVDWGHDEKTATIVSDGPIFVGGGVVNDELIAYRDNLYSWVMEAMMIPLHLLEKDK